MQQWRRITGFIVALCLPLVSSAPVFAESGSITHEIKVTAIVPSHRDIFIDRAGKITKITSNTSEDITPVVWMHSITKENSRPLSDQLLKEYRKLVPEGTAKYGVLYQSNTFLSRLQQNSVDTTIASLLKPRSDS